MLINKIVVTFIFLFVSSAICAQDKVVFLDSTMKEVPQSKALYARIYHPDGNNMYDVGEFYTGTTYRHYIAKYTSDSPPYDIEHFADGEVQFYNKDGYIAEERNYFDGKINGKQTDYYAGSYKIKSHKTYINGAHTGYDTLFYKSNSRIEYINKYDYDILITSKHYEESDSINRDNYSNNSTIRMPKFKGNRNNYLSRNIHYPEELRKLNLEGQVIVKFVVEKDGSIVQTTILKTADEAFAEEAVRVVKKMSKKWKPGKEGKKPVRVYFTMPITFKLTDCNNCR